MQLITIILNNIEAESSLLSDITTDDERIVLYYILSHKVRKVSKSKISKWLQQEEIHNVDLDNAFDLLSCLNNSDYTDDTFALDIQSFRRYTKNDPSVLPELKKMLMIILKLLIADLPICLSLTK
ncbi:hypothetical protein ACTNEM_03880 [Eubacterium pyruvativorans]|uniref:hypothetical protein n=1 Tax=Eubacterium pyruvativorans TaxID=155865 RepID=UPI003F8AEFCD